MAERRIEFHRLALKEFDEARKWYSERSPDAERKFKAAVEDAIDRISRNPALLPRYSNNYQWVRVQRFKFIVVFRSRSANEVSVVAVAHTSRRPGYWRRRV
jgi:plasmid stabilization system protein ParE